MLISPFHNFISLCSGFNCDWKLLHMLHCGGDGYRVYSDVHYSTQEIPGWHRQSSCSPHWRNSNSHANCPLCYNGDWLSSFGSAGFLDSSDLYIGLVFTQHTPQCNDMCKYVQGAITKRMTAIEEMVGMDVLCSDKTGTLTLNKLTVDKNLIEVGLCSSPNDLDACVLLY